MIYLVTALRIEARSVISYFNLKKDNTINKLPVYSNSEMKLIISGTGMLKSSLSTSFLLGKYETGFNNSVIINFGICGSSTTNYRLGTPVLCNKIIDHCTGRSYYPDMILKHQFTEDCIVTSPVAVTESNIINKDSKLFDMEAAGFAEAAFTFFEPNNVYCLKIVSDHLDSPGLNKKNVEKIIRDNILSLEKLIINATGLSRSTNDILTHKDYKLISLISQNLKLSFAMKRQLTMISKYYKISHKANLDVLQQFTSYTAESKKEGKQKLDEIRKSLD